MTNNFSMIQVKVVSLFSEYKLLVVFPTHRFLVTGNAMGEVNLVAFQPDQSFESLNHWVAKPCATCAFGSMIDSRIWRRS